MPPSAGGISSTSAPAEKPKDKAPGSTALQNPAYAYTQNPLVENYWIVLSFGLTTAGVSLAFHSATTTLPSDDGMSDYSDFSYNYSDYSYTEYFVSSRTTLRYLLCAILHDLPRIRFLKETCLDEYLLVHRRKCI